MHVLYSDDFNVFSIMGWLLYWMENLFNMFRSVCRFFLFILTVDMCNRVHTSKDMIYVVDIIKKKTSGILTLKITSKISK